MLKLENNESLGGEWGCKPAEVGSLGILAELSACVVAHALVDVDAVEGVLRIRPVPIAAVAVVAASRHIFNPKSFIYSLVEQHSLSHFSTWQCRLEMPYFETYVIIIRIDGLIH